ncbi:hypothetical protein C0J52_26196 [Blattella germanica]|nr:hypothetical protein C0J52_26196 [Blattella germanica]
MAYASRSLTEQERKFSTYELEGLAVLFRVKRFKFYLEYFQFLLETNNEALSEFPLAYGNIHEFQYKGPLLLPLIQGYKYGTAHPRFSLCNEILHCNARFDSKPKVVVPDALVSVVFSYFHYSSVGRHLGVFTTLHKIREKLI